MAAGYRPNAESLLARMKRSPSGRPPFGSPASWAILPLLALADTAEISPSPALLPNRRSSLRRPLRRSLGKPGDNQPLSSSSYLGRFHRGKHGAPSSH